MKEREVLGRLVRDIWIEWAKEQPSPKSSWLVPWENLSEPDREVDRRIGESIAKHVRDGVDALDDAIATRREEILKRWTKNPAPAGMLAVAGDRDAEREAEFRQARREFHERDDGWVDDGADGNCSRISVASEPKRGTWCKDGRQRWLCGCASMDLCETNYATDTDCDDCKWLRPEGAPPWETLAAEAMRLTQESETERERAQHAESALNESHKAHEALAIDVARVVRERDQYLARNERQSVLCGELRDRAEQAKRERDFANAQGDTFAAALDTARAEVAALRAQIEKVREAWDAYYDGTYLGNDRTSPWGRLRAAVAALAPPQSAPVASEPKRGTWHADEYAPGIRGWICSAQCCPTHNPDNERCYRCGTIRPEEPPPWEVSKLIFTTIRKEDSHG